jgi:hypothetical protein
MVTTGDERYYKRWLKRRRKVLVQLNGADKVDKIFRWRAPRS